MTHCLINCQFCETALNAQWKCKSCDLVFCADCNLKVHRKLKNCNEHEISTFKTSDTDDETVQKVKLQCIQCSTHNQEQCFTYCRNCDRCLCSACVIQPHQVEELTVVFNEKLKIVSNLKTKIEEKLPFFVENAAEFRAKNSDIRSQYNETKEHILNKEEELKRSITVEAEHLMEDLNSIWNPENNDIQKEMDRLIKIEEDLTQRKAVLDEALLAQSPSSIFQASDKVTRDIPIDIVHEVQVPKFTYSLPRTSEIGIKSYYGSVIRIPKLELIHKFSQDIINFHSFDGIVSLPNDTGVLCRLGKDDNQFKHHVILNSKFVATFNVSVESNYNHYQKSRRNIIKDITLHEDYILIINSDRGKDVYKYQCEGSESLETFITMAPLSACGVYSNSNEIFVSYISGNKTAGIQVLDNNGIYIRSFECKTTNSQKLFTIPAKIRTNINGDICIIDYSTDNSRSGQIVVLGKWGQPKWTYNGHPSVNQEDKFEPYDLITTLSGFLLVAEKETSAIHVLSIDGQFVTHFGIDEGIYRPICLNFNINGQLMIGCDGGELLFGQL